MYTKKIVNLPRDYSRLKGKGNNNKNSNDTM